MLKKLVMLLVIATSMSASAAAPVVYQAKTIIALFSDNNVINSLPGGNIVEVKYRSDLDPFRYDIISRDYVTTKLCTTPVIMKISNGDTWNPTFAVDTIGSTTCN
jgi:hypothetical protein